MTFQVEFATQPKVLNVEFDTALNISGGYDDGFNDGFSQGKSEGLTEGEEIGIAKGGNAAMQEFIDVRGIQSLYSNSYNAIFTINDDDIAWLANVDTSKWTSMLNMFQYNKQITTVPLFDTSNVTTMQNAFAYCSKLASIPHFNTKNVLYFNSTFQECYKLQSVPLFDTSSATSMYYMFYKSGIREIPLFNTSNVTDFSQMFYGSSLVTFPPLDMSKATKISSMFEEATGLKNLPILNAPLATSISGLFRRCYSLEYVPKIIAPKITGISQIFQYDSKLVTVEEIDIRNVTSTSNAFASCSKLTNLTLKNIQTNLQVGSGTSYGHLLTLESLIGLCYELRDTGATKTLTVGSANLEKLANVYVREIPITDAMREADDLIDEKLPFERCESTADGATLITDYVLLKNWKLA